MANEAEDEKPSPGPDGAAAPKQADSEPEVPATSRAKSVDGDSKDGSTSASPPDGNSLRKRSASHDSSYNDDPKSLMDSISATSGRQNWSCTKATTEGDDPSMSSIKGDSISATIADYNRKHCAHSLDNQSRTSTNRLVVESTSSKIDNSSVNINFYPAGHSTSTSATNQSCKHQPAKQQQCQQDFASTSSNAVDAFDIIEESSHMSSSSSNETNQLHASGEKEKRHGRKKLQRQLQQKKVTDVATASKRRNSKHHHRHNTVAPELIYEPPQDTVYRIEPIYIRGNGNLTLFGLSNSFSSEFPSALIGRVSREEFDRTMRRINTLLREQQSLSAKLLLLGGLFCCCSFGLSLVWPSIALKKRSKMSLKKFLASENNRLYAKLGMNWKLVEQRCYSNHAFVECVLMIEFTPKINLLQPD